MSLGLPAYRKPLDPISSFSDTVSESDESAIKALARLALGGTTWFFTAGSESN